MLPYDMGNFISGTLNIREVDSVDEIVKFFVFIYETRFFFFPYLGL